MGVDNDEYLCGLAIPSLTSIDVGSERIGYEAAKCLDRMIEGGKPPEGPTLIRPRGIVTRQSTDVLATEDQEVSCAVAFIRTRACDRIQVADVITHVGLSRATLEPRFKDVLGRTIYQEIQRVQVERIKELLATTDMPIKQIARQTGFKYVQHMSRVFTQFAEETPARYRRETRT